MSVYSIGRVMDHFPVLQINGKYLQRPELDTLQKLFAEVRDWLWQHLGSKHASEPFPGYVLVAHLGEMETVLSAQMFSQWRTGGRLSMIPDYRLQEEDLGPTAGKIFAAARSARLLPHLRHVAPLGTHRTAPIIGANLALSFEVT